MLCNRGETKGELGVKTKRDPSVLIKRALLSDRIAFQVDYKQWCLLTKIIIIIKINSGASFNLLYRGCNYYGGG